MSFLRAWHQELFAPACPVGFSTTSLVWWWTQSATFAPDERHLALVVRHDGVPVGMQDLSAKGTSHKLATS